MQNKVKTIRESQNITQNELAEISGLSLRTIQRIEAGNSLKGYTLKVIAQSLKTQPQELFHSREENINIERAKLINISALSGLIMPFGEIILPLFLTLKTKDEINKNIGKNIVSVQIILTAFSSVLLIIGPFIQKAFSLKFPFFLVILIVFICLKTIIIIINGISLNKYREIHNILKINFI